jgi:hypothetical protein
LILPSKALALLLAVLRPPSSKNKKRTLAHQE